MVARPSNPPLAVSSWDLQLQPYTPFTQNHRTTIPIDARYHQQRKSLEWWPEPELNSCTRASHPCINDTFTEALNSEDSKYLAGAGISTTKMRTRSKELIPCMAMMPTQPSSRHRLETPIHHSLSYVYYAGRGAAVPARFHPTSKRHRRRESHLLEPEKLSQSSQQERVHVRETCRLDPSVSRIVWFQTQQIVI